jgi:hypothetical protein
MRLVIPGMHRAQRAIKRGMRRFNLVNAGRRFGKDILAQDRAIEFAAVGRQPVAWLAPGYRMLAENYRMLNHVLAPIVVRRRNNERIDLLGGGFIEFWSLDQPDRVRGRKYAHAIINEAAMVADLEDAFNLVIAPTLIDLRGSCDFYTTPKGLNGFYRLWQASEDNPIWSRWHYTSYDNPHVPRDEIAMMAGMLPERVVKQEIMAEFVEDGSYFQGVDAACVIDQPDQPDQHTGHYIVAGVDWAKHEDYTVVTLACRECNRVVDWDRFNRIDFTYQRERLNTLIARWGAAVLPERNSIGEPNIEIIRANMRVLSGPDRQPGFMTTSTSKPQLIEGLSAAMAVHGFKAPKEYADELRTYQVEIRDSGRSKFSAPSGAHDDRVISLALAWWALTRAINPTGMISGV